MKVKDLGRVVGYSAYELDVMNGYEGTLEEWLKRFNESITASDEVKTVSLITL